MSKQGGYQGYELRIIRLIKAPEAELALSGPLRFWHPADPAPAYVSQDEVSKKLPRYYETGRPLGTVPSIKERALIRGSGRIC